MTPGQVGDAAFRASGALDGAARSRLAIACEEHDDMVVARMEGELDTYTARAFRAELGQWDLAAVQLVLDMTRVRLLDSAGLSALLSVRNEADRVGRRVGIIRARGGPLARLLRLCGLHRAFLVEDDLAAMRRALAGRGGRGTAAGAPVPSPSRA